MKLIGTPKEENTDILIVSRFVFAESGNFYTDFVGIGGKGNRLIVSL